MSKFTFKHEDDNYKVEVEIEEVRASEIVDAFVKFMESCTFHRSTVLKAMRDYSNDK